MKYSTEDIKNFLALSEQDEETDLSRRISKKCQNALAYTYYRFHLSSTEMNYLQSLYDPDMDPPAKRTLEKFRL